MPSCVCCLAVKQDAYWTKMCRIMKLQYIVLAGILLPLILIGSFSYLIPGFIYCKDFSYDQTELCANDCLVNHINVKGGITTTINSS